jgi:hypothetical protein
VSNKKIVVDCKITAHASPRWKAAKTEMARVAENEILARRRAEAVRKIFEQKMRAKLSDYSIDFMYDQCLADEDSVANNTVLIGAESRGQRDSIAAAKGDRSNNNQAFRRVDMDVRIARKTEEEIPTRVVHRYKKPTKTQFWYVSVAVGIGLHAGAGVNIIFVQLRNLWDQKATGIAYAAGPGVGLSGVGELARKAFKNGKELFRAAVSASFSDETSMVTDRDVGFDDFHGRRIRFTSATIQVVGGVNWSYITFSDMGDGAASVPVGGLSLAADAGVSLSTGVGLLFLIDVPPDWIVREMTTTEWNTYTSEWVTEHSMPVHFETGSADIMKANREIEEFTSKISRDFRQQ